MNEQVYNKIKKEYNDFKNELKNNIKNCSDVIKLNNKECYLIKENWDNELNNFITKYEKNNKQTSLPKYGPEFLINISSTTNYLNTNCRLKLISRNLINIIYKDKINLKDINYVTYHAGNNKIIIEYKGYNEIDSLLIINPLEDIYNQKIYILKVINKKPDKINFYKELLNLKEKNIKNFFYKSSYVITTFKEYINKNIEEFIKKKS